MISWNRLAIWALNAVALMLVPELVPRIQVHSWWAALLFALLLSFVNAYLKPTLFFITLPISFITLGIFALVINALAFWAVSGLVNGIVVPGFWTAFWGALIYSVLSALVARAFAEPKQK